MAHIRKSASKAQVSDDASFMAEPLTQLCVMTQYRVKEDEMAKNQIRKLREQKSMSQRQLAEAVATSQQQIQRIESGVQAARFDLAVRICSALEAPMEKVFPYTKKPIARLRREASVDVDLEDKHFDKGMESAGIEMEPAVLTFKFRLRGGFEGAFPISAKERDRLWGAVQDNSRLEPFMVFDSEAHRIALNMNHLVFCHFLFDPPFSIGNKDQELSFDVEVVLAGEKESLTFGAEPDSDDLANEAAEESDVQFQHLLFMAEIGTDLDYTFHFIDIDGETAFFPPKDLAMIKIPLWFVESELRKNVDDHLSE
jgi:DNA-binding XRE family transcriptional regulator